jgi:hypothetical protein
MLFDLIYQKSSAKNCYSAFPYSGIIVLSFLSRDITLKQKEVYFFVSNTYLGASSGSNCALVIIVISTSTIKLSKNINIPLFVLNPLSEVP